MLKSRSAIESGKIGSELRRLAVTIARPTVRVISFTTPTKDGRLIGLCDRRSVLDSANVSEEFPKLGRRLVGCSCRIACCCNCFKGSAYVLLRASTASFTSCSSDSRLQKTKRFYKVSDIYTDKRNLLFRCTNSILD